MPLACARRISSNLYRGALPRLLVEGTFADRGYRGPTRLSPLKLESRASACGVAPKASSPSRARAINSSLT
jgi:hypothetical protein